MPILRCRKSLRLFTITEFMNEANGLHELEAFDDDGFNQVFDETEIVKRLEDLMDHFHGGGWRFEITDTMVNSDGKLSISIDDEARLEIRDLRKQINVEHEKAFFYVLVDEEYHEFCWVVAKVQEYVFTDLK